MDAIEIVNRLIEIAEKENEITHNLSLNNLHDLIDWHMYEFKQELVPLLHELRNLADVEQWHLKETKGVEGNGRIPHCASQVSGVV